jgi:hypothetical protein
VGDGRKTVSEMMGELFREAGVLVIVFYPAGELFAPDHAVTAAGVVAGLALGVSLWLVGVLFERERRA